MHFDAAGLTVEPRDVFELRQRAYVVGLLRRNPLGKGGQLNFSQITP
jgi:hypothetical protein